MDLIKEIQTSAEKELGHEFCMVDASWDITRRKVEAIAYTRDGRRCYRGQFDPHTAFAPNPWVFIGSVPKSKSKDYEPDPCPECGHDRNEW